MVRRTSDIALLLGSRGRVKSRSGFGRSIGKMLEGWLGRSPWREERPSRRVVPGWLALAAVLAAFAGGFWLGGKSPREAAGTTLDAKPGKVAGFIDEYERPSNRQFLMASAYLRATSAQGRASAKALAEYLNGKGLQKARPYLHSTPKGQFWVVAVFYEGDAELRASTALMRGLPADVPDAAFAALRQQYEATAEGWPRSYQVAD